MGLGRGKPAGEHTLMVVRADVAGLCASAYEGRKKTRAYFALASLCAGVVLCSHQLTLNDFGEGDN